MKNIQKFNEYQEDTNISDVNDTNVLKVIGKLLKKESQDLIDNSIYKDQIESLIRGMLGIFG